jgi:restriction endonuclease Mrr
VAEPKPEKIADWLINGANNLEFKPLREVLERVLALQLKENSPEENADLSERVAPAVSKELETLASEDLAEGIASSFEISPEGYFRVLDAPEKPMLKKLRAMDPKAFEEFCAEILRKLGANSKTVGGSNDQGVDFIAVNLQLGEQTQLAPRASQALVIGQAKRYGEGRNIKPTMLREFIGGAILRAEEVRITNKIDAGLLTPVVYAYWTTSDFHLDARKYARTMGMWYLNGIGLTQLALRVGLKLD